MLSNISVKQSAVPSESRVADPNRVSETEQFDFMDYFLGLQEQISETEPVTVDSQVPTDSDLDLPTVAVSKGKKNSPNGEVNLASLFPALGVQDGSWDANVAKVEDLATGSLMDSPSQGDLPEMPPVVAFPQLTGTEKTQGDRGKPDDSPLPIETEGEQSTTLVDTTAETDRRSGLRAFQSQVAGVLESKERRSDRGPDTKTSSSVDGIELGISNLAVPPALPMEGQAGVASEESTLNATTELPELFSRVETLAREGGGSMKLTLNPPELGQVEVEVTTRGKQVQVELKSESEFTKSILESRLGELKSSMASQDLVLSKLEVSIDRELGKHLSGGAMAGDWGQKSPGFSQLANDSDASSRFSRNLHQPDRDFLASAVARAESSGFASRPLNGRLDMRI